MEQTPTEGLRMEPGWRRVAAIVAVTMAAWVIVVTLGTGEIIPPIVVFGSAFIVAWGFTRWRPNRTTFTILGVLGFLTIALNLPFVISDLAHPESAFGFISGLMPVLASLLAIFVGIAAWRPLSDRLARLVWMAAAAIFVVAAAVSIVLALGLEDDAPVAGDIPLVAEGVEFEPASLRAASGMVSLHIENKDPVRHTFTIEALDIDLELPASTDRRIEFSAPAGSYDFICSVPGHEKMTGTIVVDG